MNAYLWIFVGGGLGSVARFLISGAIDRSIGVVFPWGTIVVNVTGCFVIGVLATVTGSDGRLQVDPDFRQFLLIGICGGYTTFSSFSLQTLNLVRNGEMLSATGNTVISFAACMVAVWIGATAGQWFNQIRGG
jgi:CrcB protein